uniref:Uncharacterized protein n=1 Tax=Rhizophora mucronata TaxID=61149 RepID=A0A2P2QRL1_RHIMU
MQICELLLGLIIFPLLGCMAYMTFDNEVLVNFK